MTDEPLVPGTCATLDFPCLHAESGIIMGCQLNASAVLVTPRRTATKGLASMHPQSTSRQCSVDDCIRRVHARGLCGTHYERLRTHGDINYSQYPPVEERFWSHVQKSDGCWEWTGSRNPNGYGQMTVRSMSQYPIGAHRFSWELHYGEIPDGLFVLHECDNPPCVRPGHLFLGTAADNVADMYTKMRHRPNPRRGEANHRAKFTEQDVRTIRERFSFGATAYQMAREYGVRHSTILRIVHRQTWAHIV